MFHNSEHYRVWKLLEKAMKRPTERAFVSLLKRYGASLRHFDDALNTLYYITLHGSERQVETAIPLLMPHQYLMQGRQRQEITSFLKALTIALWYIPSLAVEKVSFAHRYFQEQLVAEAA